MAAAYPTHKPGAIPVYAGVVFRFLHEMKKGDLIVFPAKRDRQIHIGRVVGDYQYVPDEPAGYGNQRQVTWLTQLARTAFSQGALYEIGSAVTLFVVKNYAEEFRTALTGETIAPPVNEDETVAAVTEDIEETTRDFILKQLAQELKGHPLAHFVAHVLQGMGFRTRVAPEGPDGGIDIVAHKDALGLEPPIVKVQVKSTEGSVGEPTVKQLKGNLTGDEKGLLVTLGSFTGQAMAFARTVPNIRLIDGVQLVDLILEHYEQFDSRYRAAIPLKRVYVPSPLSEE
jgi:restriction system protein